MARTGTILLLLCMWCATAILCAEESRHWSYLPPSRPPLPKVQQWQWPLNPIDYFILARLEAAGIQPSDEAEPTTLVRRVALDLTGLPPDVSDIDRYLVDRSPAAYESLVSRLLANPHFGERMAQYWLDAARYADTHGYLIDAHRDMWRWRDWVIGAFNQNMPFDQFTTEQLAGDLIPRATLEQRIAAGFNRNHMINYENGAIAEQYRAEYVADRVVTTGTVWLGMTFDCARCHDHKYDPLTTREFYELAAFFNNVPEEGLDGNRGNAEPMIAAPTPQQQARWAEWKKRDAQIEMLLAERRAAAGHTIIDWEQTVQRPLRDPSIERLLAIASANRTAEQQSTIDHFCLREIDTAYRRLAEELSSIRRQLALEEQLAPSVMIMKELDAPRDTFVLLNGEFDRPSEKVEAATPSVLHAWPEHAPRNRLGLAQWIVHPQNPLAARVTVNRLWAQFFGQGLVRTPEDFGLRGEAPTNPELLDWLAVEFVESGWDVKHIVQLILTSATYRQSSCLRTELSEMDPDNRLWGVASRIRLDAEEIRDGALSVSGLLVSDIGGRSVFPYQPPGLWEEISFNPAEYTAQSYRQSRGADLYRRGLYTFWKRTLPHPVLSIFDAPTREKCTVQRTRTNTPQQALVLMNEPALVESARVLAERILREGEANSYERCRWAFRQVASRPPSPEDLDDLLALYHEQQAHFAGSPSDAVKLIGVGESKPNPSLDPIDLAAWTTVANVLLSLDEVITRN